VLSRGATEWRSGHVIPPAMFVAISLAALWLVEIPLLSGAIILAVVVTVANFGRMLTALSGFGELGYGAGFMVGAGPMVLFNQVLLALRLPPHLSQWLVICALTASTALFRWRNLASTVGIRAITPHEPLSILALALLVFGIRHQWILPFAVAVCLVERSQTLRRRPQFAQIGFLGLVVGSMPLSAALRPDRWWYFYQGNDSQFFESIGWSASHWGVFEHPGYTGGSIANYHWLSYVLIGDINHLAGTPPWDVFMKVGVLLTCAALAGVLLSLRHKLSHVVSLPSWALTGLAMTASSGAVYNSLAFSLPMAMSLFMLVDRFDSARKRLRVATLIVTTLSLAFTKTSTAVVVVAVLFVILVLGRVKPHLADFYPLTIIGVTGAILYVSLFRGASQLSALAIELPSVSYAAQAIWQLLTTPRTILQILIWTACLGALRATNLRSLYRASLPFLALSLGATLAISLARTDPLTGFITPIFNFVTFYALRTWHRSQSEDSPSTASLGLTKASILTVIGFVGGVNVGRVMNQIDLRIPSEGFLYSAFWENARQSAHLVAATALLVLINLMPRLRRSVWALAGCIMLTLGLVVGANRSTYSDAVTLGPDPLQNWRGGNSAPFSDTDLRAVGKWIRENTPSDALLASNNFCCPGIEWWYAIIDNLDVYEQDPDASVGVPRFEPSFGGDNYLIPVETRRRFYMQGLGHQPIPLGGTISQDQIDRMTLSLEFANEPSQRVANRLKSAGVDGFVVNLALTQHRDWSEFAVERFKIGNFSYLELR